MHIGAFITTVVTNELGMNPSQLPPSVLILTILSKIPCGRPQFSWKFLPLNAGEMYIPHFNNFSATKVHKTFVENKTFKPYAFQKNIFFSYYAW